MSLSDSEKLLNVTTIYQFLRNKKEVQLCDVGTAGVMIQNIFP